jgi:adenosylhomocysteine nucleosidase
MANRRPLLGIICALPAEARTAGARHAPGGEPIAISESVFVVRAGIGRARAAQAATRLVNAGAEALLSWGTAAALGADLNCGDLVLPEAVLSRDGRRLPVDSAWYRQMAEVVRRVGGACAGGVAEAEQVLDGNGKRALRTRSGALIADMESAAIVEACLDAGIRSLVVRAVSDRADMRIPSCALAAVNARGDVHIARCLARLVLAPGDLPSLLRLAKGFRQACAALSRLAQQAGPHFQLPRPVRPRAGLT